MNSSKFLRPLLLLLLALSISCSGGDDSSDGNNNGGNNNNNNGITSITLEVNFTDILIGESVSFTVTGNDGSNLTSSSTITVNGSILSSSSYSATVAGSISAIASYGNLTSNQIQINVDYDELTGIELSTNSSEYYIGDSIIFNVIGDNTEDLSSLAEISVDGTPISGNIFVPSTDGVINITATYNTFTSNSLNITINVPPSRFKQNVLIEDYTGTWCGWCPRVMYGIEQVESQTDQSIVVAAHLSASGAPDPYHNSLAVQLANAFGVSGLPTATLNRTSVWVNEANNINAVLNLTGDDGELGIALSPTLSGSNVTVDVDVKFGEDFSSSNLKLVVYLLEDGLIYNQANYTTYFGGSSVLINFEHNNVLRAAFTSALGDDITSNTGLEEIYSTSLNMSIPSNVSNSSNIKVVAYVVNESNTALNSRVANIGEIQNFEAVN